MIDDKRLQEIKDIHSSATKGPYAAYGGGVVIEAELWAVKSRKDGEELDEKRIAICWPHKKDGRYRDEDKPQCYKNAIFFASAYDIIPELLEEIERLKKK